MATSVLRSGVPESSGAFNRLRIPVKLTTLDLAEIPLAYERDPAVAEAEYGAQFRSDVEAFLSRETLQAVVPGCQVLPPVPGFVYGGFGDPSGGAQDAMTLAIAHREGERVRLDFVAERRAPFSPDAVVTEFAEALRRYRIGIVTGDRFDGEWPRDRFRAHDIAYPVDGIGDGRAQSRFEGEPAMRSVASRRQRSRRTEPPLTRSVPRTSPGSRIVAPPAPVA